MGIRMADDPLLTLSAQLGGTLRQQGWTLALAESCTGGMAAQSVTAIPGSSDWFDRGFVTYSNLSKQELLQVPADLLAQHGAVSIPTAEAMALGALQGSHADIAGAITGIAGPDGGTPEKPVGTVCFAWALRGQAPMAATHHFKGDRDAIRRQSVATLLQALLVFAGGTPTSAEGDRL